MSSGDGQQMNTQADEPELQRNREEEEEELSEIINLPISDLIGDSFTNEKDLSSLTPELVQSLYSEDVTVQLEAAQKIRKLLLEVPNPLSDEIVKSGAVPRFVSFLEDSRNPELQFESASVLANIASGNSAQTQVIIDAGAVPILIKLLTTSSNETVLEQSVQTLGNIAGDSAEYRDLVLNSNVLPPLLGLFNDDNLSTSLMRKATFTMLNLCLVKNSPPNFDQVSQCLLLLARLIFNQDAEILVNVCWALTNLSLGPKEQIQAVIDSGVCPRAVQLLSHTSTKVVLGALHLVCAITTGDDSQARVLINENVLPALFNLLFHEKESIVEFACWALSQITVGSEQQIQAVIESNLIPSLIELVRHGDLQIRQHAAKAIANATENGAEEQIVYIVEAGAIPPLCQLLSETDSDRFKSALRCIENILRTGESMAKAAVSTDNAYATLICNSPSMRPALCSENAAIQLDATKRFTILLGASVGFNLIDEIIKSGAVPRFVHFLGDSLYPELQFESASVLAYIARGSSARRQVVIDAGAVPVLSRLLSSPNENVLEKSIWALGNIACGTSAQTQVVIESGAVPVLIKLLTTSSNENVLKMSVQALGNTACYSTKSRALVLNSHVLPPLLGLFNNANLSTSMIRKLTWALARLCKNSPPNFAQVSQCLPLLTRLMVKEDVPHHDDEKILQYVCQALSHLSDGPNEQIQVVVDSGVCPRAVQLLRHASTDVVNAALGFVCAITAGDASQAQVIINANALPDVASLLFHEKESIVENACLTVANITAGNEHQIQALIDANMIPSLIVLLYHRDVQIRNMVTKAIANATANGSVKQIVYIVEAGAIPPICQLLSETDEDLIEGALICLENIISTGRGISNSANSTANRFATFVKQCGGLDKMTFLSSHNNPKIKEKACTIIEKYFA